MSEMDQTPLMKQCNPTHVIPQKLTLESTFQFRCHPGIRCFTACCSDISIVLTPYDILTLLRRLEMPAPEFLHQYTEPLLLEKTDMVGVRIRMDPETKRCPFLTDQGCSVYSDRPTSCRYYPVGMADFHKGGEECCEEENFFFLVKEDHCKGFDEKKQWSIAEWRADQGVDLRDSMNHEWFRLIMRRKSFGQQASLSEQAKRMFFMASTDLASFRRFVFESSFLDIYELDGETLRKIREDDIALMHFSFRYLASVLFGVSTIKICQAKVREKVSEIQKRRGVEIDAALREYETLKRVRAEKKVRSNTNI